MDSASRRLIPEKRVQSLEPGTATRIDVLLSLGAPETLLDGERIILYGWGTQSGLIAIGGSGGPVNTHLYDLVFEFDDQGRLIQSGDLKTLLAKGFGRDRPLDLSTPIEVPIRYSRLLRRPSSLILDRTEVRIEKSGNSPRTFTIPPGGALKLDYRTDREEGGWPNWRRYSLQFRDDSGQSGEEGFDIDVGSLLILARYLHQHSPGIEIQD